MRRNSCLACWHAKAHGMSYVGMQPCKNVLRKLLRAKMHNASAWKQAVSMAKAHGMSHAGMQTQERAAWPVGMHTHGVS